MVCDHMIIQQAEYANSETICGHHNCVVTFSVFVGKKLDKKAVSLAGKASAASITQAKIGALCIQYALIARHVLDRSS